MTRTIFNAISNVDTTVVIAEKIEARAAKRIVSGSVPDRTMKHILHAETVVQNLFCLHRTTTQNGPPEVVRSSGIRIYNGHFLSHNV